MFNKSLFRAKLVEMNITAEKIAVMIGINPATLFRKMSGESDFTRIELQNIRRILRLTPDEFDRIFFANELTKT